MALRNFRKVDNSKSADLVFQRGRTDLQGSFVFGNDKIGRIHDKAGLLELLIQRYGFKKSFEMTPPSALIDPNGNFAKFFQRYSPPYLIKRNIENGKGLYLALDRSSAMRTIMRHRSDRKPCVIVQKVITPLLVDGYAHKIRFYIVVRCQSGRVAVYISKNGYVAYGKVPYDPLHPNFEALMASPHWYKNLGEADRRRLRVRPVFYLDWDLPNKEEITGQIQEKTRDIFGAINLCTERNTILVSGADFLIGSDRRVYFIELNTLAGTHPYGLTRRDRKRETLEKSGIYREALLLSLEKGQGPQDDLRYLTRLI
jgi:hypothetical protein